MLTFFLLGCECDFYLDRNGHGNCEKEHDKQFGCYVKEPTTCTDTIASDGRLFSRFEACKKSD